MHEIKDNIHLLFAIKLQFVFFFKFHLFFVRHVWHAIFLDYSRPKMNNIYDLLIIETMHISIYYKCVYYKRNNSPKAELSWWWIYMNGKDPPNGSHVQLNGR